MTGDEDKTNNVVQKLRDSGYETVHIGKWHLGSGDYSVRRYMSWYEC